MANGDSPHSNIDNLTDMYELGGAMIDLIPPENLNLWGEGLTSEKYERYYPYIRALKGK